MIKFIMLVMAAIAVAQQYPGAAPPCTAARTASCTPKTDASGNLSVPQITLSNGSDDGYVKVCPVADSTHCVTLKSPASRSTDLVVRLPSSDPSGTQYLACGSPSSGVSTCSWSSSGGGMTGGDIWTNIRAYGGKCDGSTDNTTAINNAMTAIQAGTVNATLYFPSAGCTGAYVVLGQVVLPVNPTGTVDGYPSMRSARWVGDGSVVSGGDAGATATQYGGTQIDLRYVGADPNANCKIVSAGRGNFGMENLTLMDTTDGTTCMVLFTATTPRIKHVTFRGKNLRNSGLQAAIILGNQAVTPNNFDGYGSLIANNYFSRICTAVRAQRDANETRVQDNWVGFDSGCSATSGPVFSVNATPTAAGSGYAPGDTLTISGGDATVSVVAVDGGGGVTSVSLVSGGTGIPGAGYTVGAGKATTGGGGAGAQINITGVIGHAAFESDGGGATNIGGWWTGNSVEMVGYMDAGIYFRKSNAFHLDNLFFDGTGRTFYYFGEQAGNNKLVAYNNTGVLQSGPSAAYNTIECAAATGGGCQTTFPYQVKFLTPITLPEYGPSVVDAAGNVASTYLTNGSIYNRYTPFGGSLEDVWDVIRNSSTAYEIYINGALNTLRSPNGTIRLLSKNGEYVNIGDNANTCFYHSGRFTCPELYSPGIAVFPKLQSLPHTTDPGCASTDDIGKFWMDNTTTTTVPKLCVDVAGTMAWKTLTLAP